MNPNTLLRRFALGLGATAVLLLAGCAKQELYSNLSERQANEMIAVLKGAGIDAEKQAKEGGLYAIAAASGDFAPAIRTLSAQGYPKESYDTMGKVFKRDGFVSSPLEERARLLHAMSQEISNTLTNIDGVVTARVHLSLPEKNPLADKVQPASAAVFIKHRPDRNLASQVTQIKALVVNSIEGLQYDNVTVALFPAETIPDGTRPLAAASAPQAVSGLPLPLMAGTIAGVLALGGGGFLWMRRRGHAQNDESTVIQPAAAPTAKSRDLVASEMQNALRRAAGRK